MNLFMNYGKYKDYTAANVKSEGFDKDGLTYLFADMMERMDIYSFKYSGFLNVEKIEKEIIEETKKSGVDTIASKKASSWIAELCKENSKLRTLAQGFVLAVVLKQLGMPYKLTTKMIKGSMPKSGKGEKENELGFILSFDESKEATVVKKLSLDQYTHEYEVGYFLSSAHNSALRCLIKINSIKIEIIKKEKKDMKQLAEKLKSAKITNDLNGFIEISRICSAYEVMPFATQGQFLKIYKDLPKPRRMKKIDQPMEAFN